MGGMTSSMATKFAFFPPDPPSYKLAVDELTGRTRLVGVAERDDVDVLKLSTSRGNEILAVYVRIRPADLMVHYSQGNAVDLAIDYTKENFEELAEKFNVVYDAVGSGARLARGLFYLGNMRGKGDGGGKMPRTKSLICTRETLNRRRHPNLMEIEIVLHKPPLQQRLVTFSTRRMVFNTLALVCSVYPYVRSV